MNINYEVVPDIISGKDLDYLSDMFNWNYGAYKCSINSFKSVIDPEIKDILEESSDLFYDSMKKVLNILGGNFDE